MKLITCIVKNLRLLMRSKGSAMIVLFAPLLIVFIIGIGLIDDPEQKFNIGIHAQDRTELTNRYIESLNTTENNLIIFEEEEECKNSIMEGNSVMCTIFPEGLEIGDEKENEITFYVDESRMNFADRLISTFTTSVSVESEEISEELAKQLLRIIQVSDEEARTSLATTIKNKATLNNADSGTKTIIKITDDLDTSSESITTTYISSLANSIESDYNSLRSAAIDIKSKAENILGDLPEDKRSTLNSSINDLEEVLNGSDASQDIDKLAIAISSMGSKLEDIQEKLEDAEEAKTEIKQDINKIGDSIKILEENTDKIKNNQEKIISEIESFELREARSITSPVSINTEPITSKETRITYSFSYLIVLAILFVGLMLPSMMVFLEKDSKAFFRNFTTPTTQTYFLITNYLTSLFIIIIQTILILIIAQLFLNVPILNNIYAVLTLLFLGITMFVLIGILVGTLSGTSEAVTMTTIVLGSVFMFLSNLILPLETLNPIISNIVNYNPYVLVSESIKKAMLFGAGFKDLLTEIMIMISIIILLISVITIINKVSKKNYLSTRRHKLNTTMETDHLDIEIKGQIKNIETEEELLQALKTMNDEEYKKIITPTNYIVAWLKNNKKQKALARKIKNKNKVDTIIKLEEHVTKQINKINKKNKKKN